MRKLWVVIFLLVVAFAVSVNMAKAETFLSAGIGAEQIKFSKCAGDCGLLKENNTEGVISLRMGRYWNNPLLLPIDLGVAGTISQTGHVHVDNRGVDERTGDVMLLLRHRLEKFSPYIGFGVGSVITNTRLGGCNHGSKFLTVGVEGKAAPQSATWYVEYRRFGTHHDFAESSSEEITTRENIRAVTAGVRYTF